MREENQEFFSFLSFPFFSFLSLFFPFLSLPFSRSPSFPPNDNKNFKSPKNKCVRENEKERKEREREREEREREREERERESGRVHTLFETFLRRGAIKEDFLSLSLLSLLPLSLSLSLPRRTRRKVRQSKWPPER